MGSAQGITETFSNAPLVKALKILEKKYQLLIAYDPELVRGIRVDAEIRDADAATAMRELLQKTKLDAKVSDGNQVLIFRRKIPPDAPPRQEPPPTTIRGSIRDETNGDPLPYARIILSDSSAGTISDGNGRFRFLLPEGKSPEIRVQYLGFRAQQIRLSPAQLRGGVTIRLTPAFQQLDDIVIEGKSELPVRPLSEDGAISVNPQKVSALSMLGENDIFRALQYAPGISGTSESVAGLHIRGGTPDQNLVLLDGIPIYNTGHLFGYFNAFHADALQRVRTYRGGFGAEYGGRVSGVVDMTAVPVDADTFRAGASVNLLNGGAFVSAPLLDKKAAIMVAGRRSYSEILRSPFYNSISGNVFEIGDIFRDQTQQQNDTLQTESDPLASFYDLHSKLILRPDARNAIELTGYIGGDFLDYSFSIEDSFEFQQYTDQLRYATTGASTSWDRKWRDSLESHSVLSFSRYQNTNFRSYDIDNEVQYSSNQLNRVESMILGHNTQWKPFRRHQFLGGFRVARYETLFEQFNDVGEGEIDDTERVNGWLSELFAQHVWTPIPELKVRSGLRMSHYSPTREVYPQPRIGLLWRPNQALRIKANYGLYDQFLNNIIVDNGLSLGDNFFALADNEDTDVLQGRQLTLGAAYVKPGLLIEVEAYRKWLDGLINYSVRFNQDELTSQTQDYFSEGEGNIWGLDVLVRKQVGPWTGWASYSLGRVSHSFPNLNDGFEFDADHDQRHEFKLVNLLSAGRWDFSLTWLIASGKPYSEASRVDSIRDAEGELFYEILTDTINSARFEPYHRMDLSVTCNFPIKRRFKAKAGLTIFNVYDQDNVRDIIQTFEVPDDPADVPEIVTIERFLLGFSPNVFFRIRF